MPVVLAPWSLVVEPGKKVVHEVIRDIQITNASLGDELQDAKARTTLKLTFEAVPSFNSDDEEEEEEDEPKTVKSTVPLCSLTPGAIEQAPLNITFVEEDVLEFEAVGKNSIHLFGNYIDQHPDFDDPPMDDDFDSEEESFDLRDVSSDVEVNPDDLLSDDESRFEELDGDATAEKLAGGKKHPRESDAMDTDAPAGKKANKKQKAENGSAVPVTTEAKPAESKKDKKKKKDEKVESSPAKEGAEKEGAEKKDAEKKGPGPIKDLPNGLKIQDIKVGKGKQATAGKTISMRYIGKLQNGKTFDQNTKGKPFTFKLGKGEVIKGWDQGIVGMQVGGERLLIIPAPLAYGKSGTDGIPPNATLRFEVKLIEIK